MAILGLDYGEKHIGVAISEGFTTQGYATLFRTEAYDKLRKIIEIEKVSDIVIGMPQGRLVPQIEQFGKELKKLFDVTVIFWDETLTTQMANAQLQGLSIKKKKRKEHTVSAQILLESYLLEHQYVSK